MQLVKRDLNLERRFESAEAGGRPLSLDERTRIRRLGWYRVPPNAQTGNWYSRYRRRRALTRVHLLYVVLLCVYFAVFVMLVGLVGFPLAFIAMYFLAQATVLGVALFAKRRAKRRSQYGGA
jgi:Flp pilus assembly protein TadB